MPMSPGALGVTYYPEHTDPANWGADLDRIRACGMSFVRALDFGWTRIEPREGVYTFDELDDYLDRCQRHGLGVVMSTPTAAPPPWLSRAYPEVMAVQADGRPFPPGVRRQVSMSSQVYRHFTTRIAERLGRRYAGHPAIIAWQIDNELHGLEDHKHAGGIEDHSPEAAFRFREWLKERYDSITALNQAWGTGYWGQEFGGWEDISTPRQPRCTNAWHIDFARFNADMITEFLRLQVEALRAAIGPGLPITHNFTSVLNKGLDIPGMAAHLDVVSWDAYPYGPGDYAICAMKHDLVRCTRRAPFWVMETLPGEAASPACLAEMVANGAGAIGWWHWRRYHFAQEKWHPACVDAGGRPYPYLDTIASFARRPEPHEALPERLPPRSAAWLFSPDTIRAELYDHPHDRHEPSLKALERVYRAKWLLGVATDGLVADDLADAATLAPYRLLLIAGVRVVRPALVQALDAWVRAGGILLATGKFGSLDPWGKHHVPDVNSPVAGLVGYEVHDDEWVHDQRLRLDSGEEFVSEVWVEHAHPTTADVLGRFVGGAWDGRPAVLRHRLGKGQVWSACATSLALQRHLMPLVAHEAAIPVVDHPFTDVATLPHLLDPSRRWYFNYAREPRTVGAVTIQPGDYILI